MKLQDVLLKAMAKKMTWWEAAEIIGVTDRTIRRWRERLEAHGYSGIFPVNPESTEHPANSLRWSGPN